MINVPEEITGLLQDDNVRKNFRVHFPNGEREDITNENVVSESVSYTESICSQESLKFGLCESPCIEFETFGVEKIKGCEIECSYDIDIQDNLKTKLFSKNVYGTIPSEVGTNTEDLSVDINEYVFKSTSYSVSDVSTTKKTNNKLTVKYQVNGKTYTKQTDAVTYTYLSVYGLYIGDVAFSISEIGLLQNVTVCNVGSVRTASGTSKSNLIARFECYVAPSDPNYRFEYHTDLTYPTCKIPLGTFVVDSCKKQSDMTHRKIIAYGVDNFKFTQETNEILTRFWWDDSNITIPMSAIVKLLCPRINQNYVLQSPSSTINFGTSKGSYSLMVTYKEYDFPKSNMVAHIKEEYDPEFLDEIKTFFDTLSASDQETLMAEGCNYISGNYLTWLYYEGIETFNNLTYFAVGKAEDRVQRPLTKIFNLKQVNEWCFPRFAFDKYVTQTSTEVNKYETDTFNADEVLYYPNNKKYRIPTKVKISKAGTVLFETGTYNNKVYFDNLLFADEPFSFTPDTTVTNYNFNKYSTSTWTPSKVGELPLAIRSATFNDVIKTDWREYIEAYCELLGGFGHTKRNGDFEIIYLHDKFTALYPSLTLYPSNNLYPNGNEGATLNKSNYQTLWYDDDYLLPYGRVICTYTNTDGNTAFKELFLDGYNKDSDTSSYQTYSISFNKLIDDNQLTSDQVRSLLETLAGNISGVTYMPAEITMQGRPDIEAGDVLEIYSAEEVITTLILQKNLTGIQALTDMIRSD